MSARSGHGVPRGDAEPIYFEQPTRAELELLPASAPLPDWCYQDGPIYRRRYECRSCGFHGTREVAFPPCLIPCPRCGAAADANGPAELVQ